MPTEAEAKLSSEMEKLKKDIAKLQDDLAGVLRIAGAEGKQRLQAAYDSACGYSKDALETSRKTIEEKPFVSVLVAFVTGVLIAKILDRK
jgi:ElaB/YqjD/DUF883 family membrane-anchored ribosome-binding protein